MKKLIIAMAILALGALSLLVIHKVAQARKARLAFYDQLIRQTQQRFDRYDAARDDALLFACTEELARYQQIPLTPSFYSQEKRSAAAQFQSQQALYALLAQAKSYTGAGFAKTVDAFMAQDQKATLTPLQVTRGYCRTYQPGFAEKIAATLAHYQAVKPPVIAPLQADTVYLAPNFQLLRLTADFRKKALPTALHIGANTYPLVCHYEDAQRYQEAAASNNPIADAAYQAARKFYAHVSPQMDYLLACRTETDVTTNTVTAVTDAYPWYQPIAVGSDDKPAAGDAFVYASGDQLVVVLGHEPCACNWSSAQHCAQIKTTAREFLKRFWGLYDSFADEKAYHNAQSQHAINAFLSYGKNEVKKDFCFIDHQGILRHLAALLEQIKQAEGKNPPQFPSDFDRQPESLS